jgi:hypothetical protein
MSFETMKVAVLGVWALGWGAVAMAANATSVSSWLLLFGIGALPPVIVLPLWKAPARTTSERVGDLPV